MLRGRQNLNETPAQTLLDLALADFAFALALALDLDPLPFRLYREHTPAKDKRKIHTFNNNFVIFIKKPISSKIVLQHALLLLDIRPTKH